MTVTVQQGIPMYQGEDFAQPLSYFSDEAQSVPLVFTDPVMDVRDADGVLLARFDTTGAEAGLATITGPGALLLSMPYTETAKLPNGSYPLDIFADVAGHRDAITKRGRLKLVVTARITRDEP